MNALAAAILGRLKIKNGSMPTHSSSLMVFTENVGNYVYYGEAVPGTIASDAAWRISRKTVSNGTILYANSGLFTAVWNDRANILYSIAYQQASFTNPETINYQLPAQNFTVGLTFNGTTPIQATYYMWLSYLTSNNYYSLWYTGTNLIFRQRLNGVNKVAQKQITPLVAATDYRMVCRISPITGMDIWVDGVKGTPDATATANGAPGPVIEFGEYNGTAGQAMTLSNFIVLDFAASDAACAAL